MHSLDIEPDTGEHSTLLVAEAAGVPARRGAGDAGGKLAAGGPRRAAGQPNKPTLLLSIRNI